MLTPRQQKRLRLGFCADCGELREGTGSTLTRCSVCAERVRQCALARLRRLRAAGLCSRCQGAMGEGAAKTVCAGCRAKIKAESRAYSARRKAARQCTWCGVPAGRFIMCLKHRLVRAEQFKRVA